MAVQTAGRRLPADDPVAGRIRLDSLTALRWIAAVWVFGYHCRFLMEHNGLAHIAPAFLPGKSAVSMFFVLSGFVLAWVARRHDTRLRFYRRRFARIYPLYLTALALGIGVTFYEVGTINPWHVLATGTLTQTWFPDMDVFFAVNGPGWSLSAETFFYACFPLVLPLLLRASPRARRITLAGCAVFVIGWASFIAVSQLGVGSETYWLSTTLPLVRLPEFVAGMALGLEARDGRWPRLRLRTAIALTGVGLVADALVVLYLDDAGFRLATAAVTIVPFLVLVPTLARYDALGRTPRWVTPRLVEWGNRSYAFYLVHQLVTRTYDHWHPERTEGTAVAALTIVGMLLASMLLADLLYRHVERRFERRLRGEPARTDVAGEGPPAYPDGVAVPDRATHPTAAA